jgi:biopolymer transport protein ExbD
MRASGYQLDSKHAGEKERQMKRSVLLRSLLCGVALAASAHLALAQEKPTTSAAKTITSTSEVVSIPTDGEFYFGGERITQAEIPNRLREAFRGKPQREQIVYIRAGLNVTYQTVVSVIEMIRGAGFDQIALVTNTDDDSTLRTSVPARRAGKGRKIRRRRPANKRPVNRKSSQE